MMSPRIVVPEATRAALLNAAEMHGAATALGQLLALPTSGLPETVGVKFATLLRAMNGRLVPIPAAMKIDAWYRHAGRFLPKAGG